MIPRRQLFLKFFTVVQCFLSTSGEIEGYNTDQRIVGGITADKNEFPYAVSIRRTEMEEIFGYGNHICGGALIDNQTVVTAGHCVFDQFGNFLGSPNSYTIVAGTNYRTSRGKTEQIRKSKKIFVHPKFSLLTLYNDISIIVLDAPVVFDEVTTAAIPLANKCFSEGTPCVIVGWGSILAIPGMGPILPENLQKAEVFISPKHECIANYTLSNFTVIDSQICAGVSEGGVDSCQGDSGGPLICKNSLYGIVSTGELCGLEGFPGIYTDLTKFLTFIRNPENFGSHNLTGSQGTNSAVSILYLAPLKFVIIFTLIRFTCVYSKYKN